MTMADQVEADVRGAEYRASLAGRRAMVVGLAKSGVAAARLLDACGAAVLAVDAKPLAALGREARELDRPAPGGRGIRFVPETDASTALSDVDLVVISPGVPVDAAIPSAARARGIPVIGELELGWRAMDADTIAITGTNGKTTTTALTGALLAQRPRPVLVAGHIGTPLAQHAARVPADGLVVLEVSSFQLETVDRFHPRVAAVLNVTPDHLDRHGSVDAYARTKARIFMNQEAADCAVLNADDPGARALAGFTRADVLWFSRTRRLDHGVFVLDGRITAKLNGHLEDIGPVADIFLRGQHNVENVLAATACTLWTGIAPEEIHRGIAAFRGVAHRIEFLRQVHGVPYYNDSKGTNVDSTIKAIESFAEPIVLIVGGKGKGQDFTPLAAAARGRVCRVLTIGEDGDKIGQALAKVGIPVTRAATLDTAVTVARDTARPGDVVLLSPACASFDQFDNFEHRGDVFRKLVERLG